MAKEHILKETMEVVEVEGKDYLEEEEAILLTKNDEEESIRRLGFFRKETAGIPHWIWIGAVVAVAALGINVYFLKVRKS
ncbi:MAG: hypothetical protein GWO20_10265 [Candidatus Korarchaeota archaeon]|nr:hypothetical protein [Candidatus Korarchaeota archaeon]